MPIDPSIPLSVRPLQIQSPLEAIQPVLQLQAAREQTEARRLAADEARQKARDAAAIRQVFAETGGDIDAALPRLRMIAPGAALEFEKTLHETRKQQSDALKADYDFRGKRLDLGLQVAQSVNDDLSYRAARPMLLALSPELEPLLPETYDPARWQQLLQMGLSAKDVLAQKQEGLRLFGEGKVAEGLAKTLAVARTAEEWDATIQGALTLGAPKEIVAPFGAYSPENVARAAQFAGASSDAGFTLSPGQTRYGPGGEVVASVPAAPGSAAGGFTLSPGAVRYDAQGNVIASRPPTPAAPSSGKPSTGAHKRALSFFNRAQQADVDLQAVEAEIANLGYLGQVNLQYGPNVSQSQTGQLYNQAQRAFTEARLRKDSGAAIPAHEFESDRQTYFAQPGDSQATLQQKARARAAVLASIAFEAGPALGEFYGDDAEAMLAGLKTRAGPGASATAATVPAAVAAALGSVGPGRHTLSDGTKWEKRADGSIVKVP